MKRSMTVVCQDASGHRETISVQADTDEAACKAALAILNSWRAVRVMETRSLELAEKIEPDTPTERVNGRADHGAPAPSAPPGPRIVKKAGPIDWIDPSSRVNTNVGRALLAAARKAA